MTSAEVARLKRKYEDSYQKSLAFIKKKPSSYQKHPTQEFYNKLNEYERKKKELDKEWKANLNAYMKAESQLKKGNTMAKKKTTKTPRAKTRTKSRVLVRAHTRRFPKR